MALAIFIDAHAVAGDASLLAGVRAEVDRLVSRGRRVARPLCRGDRCVPRRARRLVEPAAAIGDTTIRPLDLKKAGIFPIVHGVRSLALRDHVQATATAARLEALVAGGRLPRRMASELVDSLHFLMGLKLKAGLAELDAQCPVSGAVRIDRLGSLERDLLRDALAVVKRFKALVRHQFHLEAA